MLMDTADLGHGVRRRGLRELEAKTKREPNTNHKRMNVDVGEVLLRKMGYRARSRARVG